MEEMKDFAKATLDAALSTTPIGAFLVTLISDLKAGIFERRFEEWKKNVETKLDELEDSVKEGLKDNELFATVLLISGQLALKTDSIKRKYLANAVANVANTELSEDQIVIMLNCIEKYTQAHFELLSFLQCPWEYDSKDHYFMTTSTMTIFEKSHSNHDNAIDKKAINDLYADGMITSNSLSAMCTVEGAFSKMTSELGDDFISFFGLTKDLGRE